MSIMNHLNRGDLKASQAAAVACMAVRIPFLLVGPPGTGKTTWLRNWATREGVLCRLLLTGLKAPEDIGGAPRITEAKSLHLEHTMTIVPPSWLDDVWVAHESKDSEAEIRWTGSVLFFDELNHGSPDVIRLLQSTLAGRKVSEQFDLPDSCALGAAMNPSEDLTGGAADLEPAVVNRLCMIRWEPSLEDRVRGMTEGWPVGPSRVTPDEDAADRWHAKVAGFLSAKPVWLDDDRRKEAMRSYEGQPWPSARSFELAADLLAAVQSLRSVSPDTRESAELIGLAGLVGKAAAVDMLDWFRSSILPDPLDVGAGRATLPPHGALRPGESHAWILQAGASASSMSDDNILRMIDQVMVWGGDSGSTLYASIMKHKGQGNLEKRLTTGGLAVAISQRITARIKGGVS